jgi:hypothetical protein
MRQQQLTNIVEECLRIRCREFTGFLPPQHAFLRQLRQKYFYLFGFLPAAQAYFTILLFALDNSAIQLI